QPYIGFGPVGQLVKPGLFLFGINVLALKYWVWYNISCSGEQQSLEYFDSSNNAGQLKYWDHDNTSCPSEHQSIESDFFIFNTAAIGVATNVLPASQSTLTSSSAGSSTVPSVVSTSASSVTPTSVVPSTIASSASSSASSSAGSSIVATSSTINSNTGIVASSTLKSSSASSSTPMTSILAATSNLAVSLSSSSVLSSVSSQCCTLDDCIIFTGHCIFGSFGLEHRAIEYPHRDYGQRDDHYHVDCASKYFCCSKCQFFDQSVVSIRFFVKSSRLNFQLDNSVIKYHDRGQHFSGVVHGLK
ncbi:hypothetical protein KCV04_g15162, partial [Aureobasidium melanogenum]